MITYKQLKTCQRLGLNTSFINFNNIIFDNYRELQNFAIIEGTGVSGRVGEKITTWKGIPVEREYTKQIYTPPLLPGEFRGDIIGETIREEIPIRCVDLDKRIPYGLAERKELSNGDVEINKVTLGEILDNPARYGSENRNLTIGQAAKAMMMSGALVSGLQTIGITAGAVSTIATLIYIVKRGLDYNKYLQLCAQNNIKPLDKYQYEGALKLLKQEKKFKDLKLSANYKSNKANIKNKIKQLKDNKSGMDKTAFQSNLEELKNNLKQNKADYKMNRSNLKSNYLKERKTKYGHF